MILSRIRVKQRRLTVVIESYCKTILEPSSALNKEFADFFISTESKYMNFKFKSYKMYPGKKN